MSALGGKADIPGSSSEVCCLLMDPKQTLTTPPGGTQPSPNLPLDGAKDAIDLADRHKSLKH
jgi:hypothetical protein